MKKIPILLTILILLAPMPTMAQKGKNSKDSQKVTVVDDESCGCELVFIDGIQTTEKDGLFGFKREDGTVICEPTYQFVDKFHGDYCLVFLDYHHCGLIDREGHIVVPVIYEEVNYPSDSMIRVRSGELYGYYDITGRLRIQPHYRAASGFNEGVAAVGIDIDSDYVAYGFIDHNDHIVIEPQYEYAFPFEEGYAIAKKYDRFAMIDHSGKERIPYKYIELTPMHDGTFLAVDALTENAALFDKNFKQLTPFIYEKALNYTDGFYIVQREGKTTFLNLKGEECCGWYDEVSGFYDGYSWVRLGDKYGIINRKGKIILPIEYDNSGNRSMEYLYSEGLFMVEKAGKFGFVDTRGQIVIPLIYQSAQHCTEGLIPVQRDGMWGFINKKGEEAIPFVFQLASFFEWGRAEVVYNGEVYKINPDGDCVKNCKTFPKGLGKR